MTRQSYHLTAMLRERDIAHMAYGTQRVVLYQEDSHGKALIPFPHYKCHTQARAHKLWQTQ